MPSRLPLSPSIHWYFALIHLSITSVLLNLASHLLTYLLTPCNRVLLDILTGSQLVKIFPAFYGTRTFITEFTHARHLSLSSAILGRTKTSVQSRVLSVWTFRNVKRFWVEELLAPSPTPKLVDHLLSAVRDCLFNIFAATLHIGGRSSICNLTTRHAVVTAQLKTPLEKAFQFVCFLRSINSYL